MYEEHKDISVLVGKTVTNITPLDAVGEEELVFTCSDGSRYKMFHDRDCCESVSIDDVVGDLRWLLDTPIVSAEEVSNAEELAKDTSGDSYTWTFYNISTNRGTVTLKWYGTSNGYYSEGVDFVQLPFKSPF